MTWRWPGGQRGRRRHPLHVRRRAPVLPGDRQAPGRPASWSVQHHVLIAGGDEPAARMQAHAWVADWNLSGSTLTPTSSGRPRKPSVPQPAALRQLRTRVSSTRRRGRRGRSPAPPGTSRSSLAEEARMAQVIDPAGGSWYVSPDPGTGRESLGASSARSSGGMGAALREGYPRLRRKPLTANGVENGRTGERTPWASTCTPTSTTSPGRGRGTPAPVPVRPPARRFKTPSRSRPLDAPPPAGPDRVRPPSAALVGPTSPPPGGSSPTRVTPSPSPLSGRAGSPRF